MDTDAASPPPAFKDRKAWLAFFGILLIVFGAICGLMIPLMILGLVLSRSMGEPEHQMSMATMVPAALFYLFLAVWWIWMGIGAFQARRWARALILVSSWLWLVIGILSLLSSLVFLPNMYDQMAATGELPAGMVTIMMVMTIAFMSVFYLIIPAALVVFFRSKHVKATCEALHPGKSWTDRCPLPVLALSLLFAFWALWIPTLGFYNWAVPFFGIILTGAAGAAVTLLTMAIAAYAAWGIRKLELRAWWASLGLVFFWFLSAGITFGQTDLMEFYRQMGTFTEDQLEMMESFHISESGILILMGLSLVLLGGYILFTKRYFSSGEPVAALPSEPGDPSIK